MWNWQSDTFCCERFKQRININPVISILKLPQTSNTDDRFLELLSAYEQVPGAGGLFSRPRSPVRLWLRPSVDPEASRRTRETISGTHGIISFKGMKISGFVIFWSVQDETPTFFLPLRCNSSRRLSLYTRAVIGLNNLYT